MWVDLLTFYEILSDIRQESILWPLFFAIYTNNLPDTLQYIIPYKELKFILLTGFDKSHFPHAQ